MYKTLRSFLLIFLFQLLVLYHLNKYYDLKDISDTYSSSSTIFYLITYISASFIFYLVVGIIIIIIISYYYLVKVNRDFGPNQTYHKIRVLDRYNKFTNKFKVIYFLFIILPIFITIGNNKIQDYINKRPIYIYSIEDFEKIKDNPNGTYILKKDLDFNNKKVDTNSYDYCSLSPDELIFNGVFDGNGHTIKNVKEPLFFCTQYKAFIKNLTITNVNLQGKYADYTGVIANENNGDIDNVHIEGNVKGYNNTGGLVGINMNGTITNSSFSGKVEGIDNVGGLVGSNNRIIKNSYSNIEVIGKNNVGGLIGNSSGSYSLLENLYSNGTVEGNEQVGGLIGVNTSEVINTYTYSNVTGIKYVGGLIGRTANEKIKYSFVLGNTSGTEYVGGIIFGFSDSNPIEYSFIYGNVNGNKEVISMAPDYFNSFYYENHLVNDEFNVDQDIVTKNELLDINWYKNTLKLDESIWDLEPVKNGYFPKLKGISDQVNIEIK